MIRSIARPPAGRRRLRCAALLWLLVPALSAHAAERTLTWSSREDFELAPEGAPPRVSVNLDTRSAPGSVTLSSLLAAGRPAGPAPILVGRVATNGPPALAANPDRHEYLVLWRDNSKGIDVIGQLLDRVGKPRGKPIPVAVARGAEHRPRVAWGGPSAHYLVVWEDSRDNDRIYGRRVAANGALAGKEFAVSQSAGGQVSPDVATHPGTGVSLVVWVGDRDARKAVCARLVDAKGRPLGTDVILSDAAAVPSPPRVAAGGPQGGFLVLWSDRRAGSADILGRRVGADGRPDGPLLEVRASAHNEVLSSLSSSADGFLVVWDDHRAEPPPDAQPVTPPFIFASRARADSGSDIFAQRLDAAGSPRGPEIPLVLGRRNQLHGAAARVPSIGQDVVVWQDGRHGYEAWNVGTRALTDKGDLLELELFLGMDQEQLAPAVACDASTGDCLVVWWHQLAAARPTSELWARRLVSISGAAGVLSGIAVDTGTYRPTWRGLSWSASTPLGSSVSFRTRSASHASDLALAPWSEPLVVPGQRPASPPGRWLEIEARLESADGKSAPVLEEFSLSFAD